MDRILINSLTTKLAPKLSAITTLSPNVKRISIIFAWTQSMLIRFLGSTGTIIFSRKKIIKITLVSSNLKVKKHIKIAFGDPFRSSENNIMIS